MKKSRPKTESSDRLESQDRETVVPGPDTVKSRPKSPELADDDIPELFEPLEFKDQPIQFKMFLDGREESVKIVEPNVDIPFPEGARLRAFLGDACIADLAFKFNSQCSRPYRLRFFVFGNNDYPNGKPISFGPGDENSKHVFRQTIIHQGGIKADIEMSHGKARLHIQYLNPV